MITKAETLELLKSTESYRVEHTVIIGNMDKSCEVISAFPKICHDSARTVTETNANFVNVTSILS